MFHLNFSGCIISSCCEGFPSKAPESFSSCSLAAPLQGTSGINPNSQATERASTLKGDECISWTQENSIQQKPWDDWNGCFVSSLYLWMIGDWMIWMIWMLCDLSLIELWIIVVSLDLFRLFRDSSGANQFAVWKKKHGNYEVHRRKWRTWRFCTCSLRWQQHFFGVAAEKP